MIRILSMRSLHREHADYSPMPPASQRHREMQVQESLENELGLQRLLAKPADLGQIVTRKVSYSRVRQNNSGTMAADRDENDLKVLPKADEAMIRAHIGGDGVTPVIRVVHLKGHVKNGPLARHWGPPWVCGNARRVTFRSAPF